MTMTINDAITYLRNIKNIGSGKNFQKCLDMAIHSLEMQNELAEYSGMDICKWNEDYDYDENDISDYEYEASVDNFLIDEVKEEEND